MRADRRHGDDGFALVAVLAVMALLSSLLIGLSLWSRNAVENAAVAGSDGRMDALLHSAATVAAYQLFVLKLPPAQVGGQQLALDAGTATISIADDGGRVDLNGADPALLAAAYRASGLAAMPPAVFAARVADWRDADDTPSEDGAESGAYRAAGLPPPRNGGFRLVSDLRWVLGLDAAAVKALMPFVTVVNPAGRLDPYAAPDALIRNLDGITKADASRAAGLLRRPRTEQNENGLREILGDRQALFDFGAPSVLRISIEAKESGGGRSERISLAAAASSSNSYGFRIIDWR